MVTIMNNAPNNFDPQFYTGDTYNSPVRDISIMDKFLPNTCFYLRAIFGPMLSLCLAAQLKKADDHAWALNSARIARTLEASGCKFSITGMDALKNMNEPCVIVANHMSTLETFVLPSLIRPHMPVTFVIKKSLTTTPLFGKVLESRDAIAVGRTNPRQDFQLVIDEGKKRLENGMSVVIFPQSTRSVVFNPAKFNSIGIKLAKHAKKPIIPLALKTDAWGQGKLMKDFGPVQKEKTIHLAFGEPMHIEGNGKEEHAQICQFISHKLELWAKEER